MVTLWRQVAQDPRIWAGVLLNLLILVGLLNHKRRKR